MKTAKRPSIRDVAREAGVSHTTVSMILNGKKIGSAETRERVLEVSKRLDYQPDRLFRKAVTERTKKAHADRKETLNKVLGLILSTTYYEATQRNDGYYSGVFLGICQAAEEEGWSVMISPQPPNPDGLPEMILEDRVDGVLLEGVFPLEWLSALTQRIPVGFINTYYPSLDAVCVTANWERVGFKLAEYAWMMGHRRIVFFRHDTPSENLSRVSRGIDEALKHYSDARLHEKLSRPRAIPLGADDDVYETFADEWFAEREKPTIIISTDYYIERVGSALARRGVKIPEEVSLLGRGGNRQPVPGLPLVTTYVDPVGEIGRLATKMMIEALKTGRFHSSHTMLDGEFLLRKSVRNLNE